jgi:Mrp family chromosome partitioning ATPase
MSMPRLIFVTGKGGTGKSTVAAALGLALSRQFTTTIVDLDQRRSAARIFDAEQSPTCIREKLEAVSLTPRAELQTFIERIVPLKAISRRMLESRTFGYVSAALPGLEAFLMLERLSLMAGKAALEDRYVVVDAPATGGAIELLSVADRLKELAPLGTLNRLAGEVEGFLRDANRFGVIVTLRPEELALREALDVAAIIRGKLRIQCTAGVLNGVADALFTAGELAKLRRLPAHACLADCRRLNAEFAAHARRELKRAAIDVIDLPMLFRPTLGREELEVLANELEVKLRPQ